MFLINRQDSNLVFINAGISLNITFGEIAGKSGLTFQSVAGPDTCPLIPALVLYTEEGAIICNTSPSISALMALDVEAADVVMSDVMAVALRRYNLKLDSIRDVTFEGLVTDADRCYMIFSAKVVKGVPYPGLSALSFDKTTLLSLILMGN